MFIRVARWGESVGIPTLCCRRFHLRNADERGLPALHRAGADAALARDLAHALAGAQLRLDSLLDGGIDFRPTKLLALFDRPL